MSPDGTVRSVMKSSALTVDNQHWINVVPSSCFLKRVGRCVQRSIIDKDLRRRIEPEVLHHVVQHASFVATLVVDKHTRRNTNPRFRELVACTAVDFTIATGDSEGLVD